MPAKQFDRFNKRLFQELLSPYGQVLPNLAVLGEERLIDIFFVPDAPTPLNEQELGNLAEIARTPALIEPFRSALSDEDVTGCLMKLFLVDADQQREHPTVELGGRKPRLWLFAAEVSDRLLSDLKAEIDPDYGEGYYVLLKTLRTTIVAIAELPTVPETLWLRLLGKGDVQERAIAELLELPERDPKRESALNLVVSWRINIAVMEEVEQEERAIQMALSQAYLEWEKQTERRGQERGLEQGLERGLEQGERRTQQRAIVSILTARFGSVDAQLEAIIPALMSQPIETVTPMLLQLSKEELLQRFSG